jgi:MoaA/NifB/PqqE/SkfB family radical SAM enzyme
VGRWAAHEDEVLDADDVARLERFHKKKNRTGGPGPRVSALPYLQSPEMFGCFAGRRWIHVDGNGEVLPCAYMPLSFGNIKEKSLKEIWKEMTRYQWFKGRCSCQMKEPKFRAEHKGILGK